MKKNADNNSSRAGYSTAGNRPVRVNSSNTRKTTTKKKSKKSKKKGNGGAVAAVVLVLLLAVGGAGFYAYKTGFFAPKYEISVNGEVVKVSENELREQLTTTNIVDGIIIDGIDVSGMSREQAIEVLRANQPPMPTLDISLSVGGNIYPLDLSSLSLTYNLEEVVNQACAYLKLAGNEDGQTLVSIYNQREALKVNPVNYNTAYTLSTDGISSIVNGVLSSISTEAQDAAFTGFNPETCQFEYTPSVTGYQVDFEQATADVDSLLSSGTYQGVVEVAASTVVPAFTTEMIQNDFGLIASSSSTTTTNNNRNHNIRITCEKINGLYLLPGESFSFNGFIGERTAASGYEVAGVIENGQSAQAYGGGICQVSSMIYQSVIKSDLEVVERHVHMWPSTYAEAGTDAAVDWPDQDFSFRNNTDYPVAVTAYWNIDTRVITVNIYGRLLPDGQYIEFDGETTATRTAGTNYIPNASMPVGQTNQVRPAHNGVTAYGYQIWMDANGNEIRRVELPVSYYSTINAQIEVGVLNPDGSNAVLNTETGELSGVVDAPAPAPDPAPAEPAPEQPAPEQPAPEAQPA